MWETGSVTRVANMSLRWLLVSSSLVKSHFVSSVFAGLSSTQACLCFIRHCRRCFRSFGLFLENHSSPWCCYARYQWGCNLTIELNPISKAGCSHRHSRGRKSGFRSHVMPRALCFSQPWKEKGNWHNQRFFTQIYTVVKAAQKFCWYLKSGTQT